MGNSALIFPLDFTVSHASLNPDVRVVCGEEARTEALSGDADIVEVAVGAEQVRLVLRGFKVMRPPRPARSNGSNALYLASGMDKRDGLLLQYLLPHATTSHHYHAHTRETFHVLAGDAVLRTPWGTETFLTRGHSVTSEAFVPHQVVTGGTASVILIEMVMPDASVGMEDHFYVDVQRAIDVDSRGEFPASALSNFAAHGFSVDDVPCASMEGFLQALKEPDPVAQRVICALIGIDAKRRGVELSRARHISDPLYWQGQAVYRHSAAYQALLDRAFGELAKDGGFQATLLATGDALLTHRVGKKIPSETILTETEFCSRLLKIRHSLR